ncbi:MAG: DUF1924 domain-containing protein [Gammaproteobacteria bacterium]|jgi:hypothetical protein|nr:DUF1924 domain-containing protein [Gammaproteobacteria bacterium]MBT3724342.1 DUF1924 domain-containing protein [Gammaproteobacteria bacterium]MBT4076105.1 DUF1924 domain-containing protein [Gammaproteobacteria bacterium]MBT4193605.1 DUF1924 domain-containing protein [Gammaproteobacteria bacterium]MBT4452046.1 DUF1924 domain-containing protein [Gammaproteobacteria bacterium]
MKKPVLILVLCITSLSAFQAYANPTVNNLLQKYQQQGAGTVAPDQGKNLWYAKKGDRSCTSCHGNSPEQTGKHIKTGKAIKPMSASANPKRFQDSKKVEKWFLRNCKWTLGRQCTMQEKADTLSWLSSF